MKTEKEFCPDPKMKRLYFIYLVLIVVPLLGLGFGAMFYLITINQQMVATILAIFYILPIVVITIFVSYWIPKFYDSIRYTLTENEVKVERGVWWKMRHAVPFSRIMSVDTIQGPISRRLGVGTVDIYTAGYTGRSGGGGGPRSRRAEASIICIPNFLELREEILSSGELPPAFAGGFLLQRPDSVPHSPRAQSPVDGNFLSSHVWKVGYGGLGLHRRKFGLSHAY